MPGSAVEELMHNNLPRIRGMLKQHYKKMRAQDPSSKASQVHDLTLGMIGPKENPDMSQCGGAARRSLLPFVVEVLESFQITLPQPCAGHLMRAGNALKHYMFTLPITSISWDSVTIYTHLAELSARIIEY